MTVKQTIFHLETLQEDRAMDLSPEEHHSLSLATSILRTLPEAYEHMVDAILDLPNEP